MPYQALQSLSAGEFKRFCGVNRIIRKVEDILTKCGKFRLPSQRQWYQPGWEWKVFIVDAGEVEIER
ncbi:hypothetical protein P7L53_10590, partial [Thermoleptolyngbya sichuanensis XZ-Cy5]